MHRKSFFFKPVLTAFINNLSHISFDECYNTIETSIVLVVLCSVLKFYATFIWVSYKFRKIKWDSLENLPANMSASCFRNSQRSNSQELSYKDGPENNNNHFERSTSFFFLQQMLKKNVQKFFLNVSKMMSTAIRNCNEFEIPQNYCISSNHLYLFPPKAFLNCLTNVFKDPYWVPLVNTDRARLSEIASNVKCWKSRHLF